MADGDEGTIGRQMALLARNGVDEIDADQPLGITATHELLDRLVPQHLDVRMRKEAILQDLLGAKGIAAVD